MFSGSQRAFYEQVLKEVLGANVTLKKNASIGGGCINNAQRLDTNQGAYFLKWNPSIPEDMFALERKGLELLRSADEVKIPAVYGHGTIDGKRYLLLEYVEGAPRKPDYWQHYGRAMANLHQSHTRKNYGLDHDNYIGSLPQENEPMDNWIDFFRDNRLEFQLQLVLQGGLVDGRFAERYRKFYDYLPELLPENPPALLHGDMWSGNVMTGPDGYVCLMDPAVYFGHREIELAFTQMFGGFDRDFYAAYHEAYPLDPGYDERVPIYNIYPHMTHVNLFGTSYLSGVESVLSRYLGKG